MRRMANVIEYLPVDGYWFSADAPKARGTTNVPQLLPIFGYVDLIPRLPEGFTAHVDELDQTNNPAGSGNVADTDLAIPTVVGRIWAGRLSTINTVDTPTVLVVANMPCLGLEGKLIYDVRFREVTYNLLPQHISPFAFEAPLGQTSPILLTDNELERLPYGGPPVKWYHGMPIPLGTPTREHVPLRLLKAG